MQQVKHKLTEEQINEILDCIPVNKTISYELAEVNLRKLRNNLKAQLVNIELYPAMFENFKNIILKQYKNSIINPGESVGQLAAQSIGEPTTQMSVGFDEIVEVLFLDKIKVIKIGELIDNMLTTYKNIIYLNKNFDSCFVNINEDIFIRSISTTMDENKKYNIEWKKITQISRHPPNGNMIKVTCEHGYKVVSTLSHSHLTRNNNGNIIPILGSDLKLGDKIPIFNLDTVIWSSIIDIVYVNYTYKYVYDFSVEGYNNFLTGNIFVHNTLNTFHMAGMSDKNVTLGVPKLNEILNATVNPKIVNCNVYVKNASTMQELEDLTGKLLKHVTLLKLLKTYNVIRNKTPEKWYSFYTMIYNIDIEQTEWCLELIFDNRKLFENNINLREISTIIEKQYDDIQCVFSPMNEEPQIDLFIDTSHIKLDDDLFHLTNDNKEEYYLCDVVLPTLLNKLTLSGIEGINNVFYSNSGNEWIIETEGGKMSDLFSIKHVDKNRTFSNNMWDIYHTLGIEAARTFLCNEVKSILSFDGTYIDQRHIDLLIDTMTFSGTIMAVSRYGIQREQAGPIAKASHEESLSNFFAAGLNGENEKMKSVSSSIMCGNKAKVGTHAFSIMIDINSLIKAKENQDTTQLIEKSSGNIVEEITTNETTNGSDDKIDEEDEIDNIIAILHKLEY